MCMCERESAFVIACAHFVHAFASAGMSVCLYLCVCACVSVLSNTVNDLSCMILPVASEPFLSYIEASIASTLNFHYY